ncbi:MAG: glycosyltransferase family 2 protein, partial [Betaproteobacteria bacterium]|nr:glycosyltransferase family 2 protein [Betaproteobacteria bacterium]
MGLARGALAAKFQARESPRAHRAARALERPKGQAACGRLRGIPPLGTTDQFEVGRTVTQVSVVLPTFNRAAWLPHAIDSVLHQRFQDFELIVVDDGSSDDTPEVLKRYGDALKWVTQPNAGVSCARNRGISMARGDWLAFIDSDDEW